MPVCLGRKWHNAFGLSRDAANKWRGEHLGDLSRAVYWGKTEKTFARSEKGKLETREGKKETNFVTLGDNSQLFSWPLKGSANKKSCCKPEKEELGTAELSCSIWAAQCSSAAQFRGCQTGPAVLGHRRGQKDTWKGCPSFYPEDTYPRQAFPLLVNCVTLSRCQDGA